MEIKIGSYKVRLEILILIVVVFWILFGHLLVSCCTYPLKETFDNFVGDKRARANIKEKAKQIMDKVYDRQYENKLVTTGPGENINTTKVEGFTNANNAAFEPEFSGSQSPGYILPPDTWSMPTLEYSKGVTPNAGVQAIFDRPAQPVPLPEGELNMLATTPFKPECCPNTYSSSTGCACMTVDQYKYLIERGGNNIPFSQY